MVAYRYPGPICQVRDWYDGLDDGTLARSLSPLPGTLCAPDSAGANQPCTLVVAEGACAFLNPRLGEGETVKAPQEAFDRLRSLNPEAKPSAPQAKATQSWEFGAASPAVEQTIKIGNQSIALLRPDEQNAKGKNLPETEQVAKALQAVPANQRIHVKTVILIPNANPESKPNKVVAGETMSGVITLFPMAGPQSQNDFDNRIMHEAAHAYHGSFWFPEHLSAWEKAMKDDNRLPSDYSKSRTDEDFSEFCILYNTTKGTACEASAKQLYGNRWRTFEDFQKSKV